MSEIKSKQGKVAKKSYIVKPPTSVGDWNLNPRGSYKGVSNIYMRVISLNGKG